jgi:hypothetical protein
MDRRNLLGIGIAGAAAACLPAAAMAQRRLWRIGYHSAGSAQSNAGWLDAFRQGMSELGRSESRDYVIDARYADGRSELVQRRLRGFSSRSDSADDQHRGHKKHHPGHHGHQRRS